MLQEELMQVLPVETAAGRYSVHIERGALLRAGSLVQKAIGRRRLFVVADYAVWDFLGQQVEHGLRGADWEPLATRMGEPRKRLATVEILCAKLHSAGADRHSAVIALGGGIAGDVGGFVAACYMRGIDYVQVPTTLLAQVDASVGGKTGVNLVGGKNLVGAFHQPRLVLVDPSTLDTLPSREYRAGLQEVVKHGIIRSSGLFEFMESRSEDVLARDPSAVERMIADSVRIKAAVVRADEREQGLRRVLNFGHTLGHALEAETGYRSLLHGEAVAFGMVAATRLSQLRGRIPGSLRRRVERVVLSYAPDLGESLRSVDPASVAARVGGDKKAVGGRARFVLTDGIGQTSEELDPPRADVLSATRHAMRAFGAGDESPAG